MNGYSSDGSSDADRQDSRRAAAVAAGHSSRAQLLAEQFGSPLPRTASTVRAARAAGVCVRERRERGVCV